MGVLERVVRAMAAMRIMAPPSQASGAEVFAEEEDAEQGADEGFHVEEDSCLRGGDLGHAPVPEQRGGGGAEQAAGGEGEPGFEADSVDGRWAVRDGDVDGEHDGADGDAVGGDDDVAVTAHEALVEEDPEERDEEGEDDEEVAGERGSAVGVMMRSAEGDEGCAGGGEGEGGPA